MNDYSYADMMRMQEEAKQRVLDMKKRAREYADTFSYERAAENEKEPKPDIIPEKAKAISYPVEFDRPVKSNNDYCRNNIISAQKKCGISTALNKVFGNLSEEETERMFIMALCLLLSNESGDDELVLSLMYLLT